MKLVRPHGVCTSWLLASRYQQSSRLWAGTDPYSLCRSKGWPVLQHAGIVRGVLLDQCRFLSLRGGGSAGKSTSTGQIKFENSRVVIDVQGLQCGACVLKGEAALKGVPGVAEANINLATSTATVSLSGVAQGATIPKPADLVAALASRGYPSKVLWISSDLETWNQQSVSSEEEREAITPAQRHEREAVASRRRVQTSILLLAVSATAHLVHHAHHLSPGHVPSSFDSLLPAGWFGWLQAGIATAALMGPGSSLIKSGQASLRRLSPDMNSLVSTGVLAVYFSSLVAMLKPSLGLTATFHEPVMLLGAVLLGRSLQARQRLKVARGLQVLFDIRPDKARLVDADGGVKEVPASRVQIGDTVEVLPSDKFPTDGVIQEGRTAADESSLTGELIPVPKGPGDAVRAGTLSTGDGGVVWLRATTTASQSMLASVIALVEDAQARKVPVQRLADRIAGKLTWVVFAASASTLVFWGALSPTLFGFWSSAAAATATSTATSRVALAKALAGGSSWALGARLAVDVCLVVCPCSLGLATPTAVMVGTGVAAEHGLLLKGADVLETARKVTTVVFDKTGTLTTGKPAISGVISLSEEWSKGRILEVAAAVERGCRHPLAEAVVVAARKGAPGRSSRLQAEDLRTVPGMGASAQVKLDDGDGGMSVVHVGSPRYMREAGFCNATKGEDSSSRLAFDPVVRRLLLSVDDTGVDTDANVAGEFEADREGEDGDGDEDEARSAALSHEVTRRVSEGQTVIVVAVNGRPIGLLFAVDAVRPGASAAVASLAGRGLTVTIASGDRREAVWAAAAATGVPRDATIYGATPADKVSLVRSLQARGEVVMLVGDGINDSPALAAADVGVVLRAGTGQAMETGDVVLMRDDVRGAETAIDVSLRTMRKVRENLMWSLGYNIVAIPLAAGAFLPGWGVMLSPALAGAIMSCSSVAVVTNSLLLRRTLEREFDKETRVSYPRSR